MSIPILIIHVYMVDDTEAYYSLEWGDRLAYDDRGYLVLEAPMRGSQATVIGHASAVRELKIVPPTRPAVKVMPEGWDIDALQAGRALPSSG